MQKSVVSMFVVVSYEKLEESGSLQADGSEVVGSYHACQAPNKQRSSHGRRETQHDAW